VRKEGPYVAPSALIVCRLNLIVSEGGWSATVPQAFQQE
jgi:hypothetical protein